MYERVMFFIDGENLVCRYQNMLEQGYQPLNAIKHEKDIYVWHRDIIRGDVGKIIRVNYYTSATASEETIASLNEDEFARLEKEIFDFLGEDGKFGNMVAENFGLSNLALKSLVKRSNNFCYKGLKLVRKI